MLNKQLKIGNYVTRKSLRVQHKWKKYLKGKNTAPRHSKDAREKRRYSRVFASENSLLNILESETSTFIFSPSDHRKLNSSIWNKVYLSHDQPFFNNIIPCQSATVVRYHRLFK